MVGYIHKKYISRKFAYIKRNKYGKPFLSFVILYLDLDILQHYRLNACA